MLCTNCYFTVHISLFLNRLISDMNDQKLQYEHQIKELESDMNNQKLQYEHQTKELETRSYIVCI